MPTPPKWGKSGETISKNKELHKIADNDHTNENQNTLLYYKKSSQYSLGIHVGKCTNKWEQHRAKTAIKNISDFQDKNRPKTKIGKKSYDSVVRSIQSPI